MPSLSKSRSPQAGDEPSPGRRWAVPKPKIGRVPESEIGSSPGRRWAVPSRRWESGRFGQGEATRQCRSGRVSGSVRNGSPPSERMNSPLENREVRLRGLHGEPVPGGGVSRRGEYRAARICRSPAQPHWRAGLQLLCKTIQPMDIQSYHAALARDGQSAQADFVSSLRRIHSLCLLAPPNSLLPRSGSACPAYGCAGHSPAPGGSAAP